MSNRDRYNSHRIWMNEKDMGPIWVPTSSVSPSESQTIGAYMKAVGDYLMGRDPGGEDLQSFEGYSVAGYEFETDLDVIEEQARRYEFDVASIYE